MVFSVAEIKDPLFIQPYKIFLVSFIHSLPSAQEVGWVLMLGGLVGGGRVLADTRLILTPCL